MEEHQNELSTPSKINLKEIHKIMEKSDKKIILIYYEKEDVLFISKQKQFTVTLYSDGSYNYMNESEEKNQKHIAKIYYETLDFLMITIHPLYCKENMCKYNKLFSLSRCKRINYLKKSCLKHVMNNTLN